MVAVLLSAGAKPNLVTDPTTQNPSGCTAADLASLKGYDGLAAYLSEEALVAQFNDMAVAGNASGSLQTSRTEATNLNNVNEDELYLKETLAAYRTAADAAARIQTVFREHSLKIRTKAVESSNPEDEARNIVAALKIQHAFRNHETKKKMAAAARIQYRFHTWKMRKDFLNMRRQAVKIQVNALHFLLLVCVILYIISKSNFLLLVTVNRHDFSLISPIKPSLTNFRVSHIVKFRYSFFNPLFF